MTTLYHIHCTQYSIIDVVEYLHPALVGDAGEVGTPPVVILNSSLTQLRDRDRERQRERERETERKRERERERGSYHHHYACTLVNDEKIGGQLAEICM